MKFVFDLGNVMVYYRPAEYLKSLGYAGEKLEELRRAIFMSQAWLDCDAGLISRGQEIETICADNPALEADIRRVMARCDEMLTPIPGSVRTLKRLTMQGYDCYYLSNTNAPAMEFMQGYDYFGMFRGGVASYMYKTAKPDPAIFGIFLDKFGLRGEDCTFVDDNPDNVRAAAACGFNAVRLEDPDGLYERIDLLTRPSAM